MRQQAIMLLRERSTVTSDRTDHSATGATTIPDPGMIASDVNPDTLTEGDVRCYRLT